MGEHSIIPPSSASIWGKSGGCTGWVVMAQMHPEMDEHKQAAADGEASHEVGEQLIRKAAKADKGQALAVGDTASNSVIITDEMFDAAELYANDVAVVMRSVKVFGGPSLGIEHKVHARRIHELSYGITDCFIFDRINRILYTWDYKFGHLIVESFENWQGINYVAGLLDELGIDGIEDQKLTVKMRIVQPRAFHKDGPIREWSVLASDLRGYINILESNAKEALGSHAVLNTGSHCRFCQARHACAPALEAGIALFEASAAPLPVDLSIEAMGLQLSIVIRAVEQLKALKSGYEEQVKASLRGGKLVPGWALEPSFGREKWSKPIDEVIALGDLFGQDLRKPGTITPNQARQLGIDKAVIKPYCEVPKTGLTLTPDNGSKAKEIFSK